jgi:hypothetical protein
MYFQANGYAKNSYVNNSLTLQISKFKKAKAFARFGRAKALLSVHTNSFLTTVSQFSSSPPQILFGVSNSKYLAQYHLSP